MDSWQEQAALAPRIGAIIPAFFSPRVEDDLVRRLLWMTLADGPQYLPAGQTWVVVDGDPRTARLLREMIAARMTPETAPRVLELPENRGKFGALCAGMAALLDASPGVDYVAIRDGDGDHSLSDMMGLVRAADYLVQRHGHGQVIVIGARHSRHRPMGWLRGELEDLLDGLTVDALAYAMARQGRAPAILSTGGPGSPDLSSGFKIYGRELARALFVDATPTFATLSPEDYWHYGPETVTLIEAALQGAVVAELMRSTWDGQPATSFGEFRQVTLYGELLAWVYARLDIPVAVGAQLYDQRATGRPLVAAPGGAELLGSVRQYALEKVAAYRGDEGPLPAPTPTLPFL